MTYAMIRRRAVAATLATHAWHPRSLEHRYTSLGTPYQTHQFCYQGKFYAAWL